MTGIKVFSTPQCPWCKKAKAYLEEKGIGFKDINVVEDIAARDEMIEKSGQMGVPVIEIDGKFIIGFDQKALDKALAKMEDAPVKEEAKDAKETPAEKDTEEAEEAAEPEEDYPDAEDTDTHKHDEDEKEKG